MILNTAVGLVEQVDDRLVVIYRPNFEMETWVELAPLLEPALQYGNGEYTLADMHDYCRAEQANLWGYYVSNVPQMAMVTTIITYPGIRYLHIMALGGNGLLRAMKMWNVVEQFMQCNGCTRVTAYTRPNMAKVLARYCGFSEMYTVMGRWSKGVH